MEKFLLPPMTSEPEQDSASPCCVGGKAVLWRLLCIITLQRGKLAALNDA